MKTGAISVEKPDSMRMNEKLNIMTLVIGHHRNLTEEWKISLDK